MLWSLRIAVGAHKAVSHLIEHGHREIACIGYDQHVYALKERIGGYRDRMREAGLNPHIALDLTTPELTHEWLAKAVFAKNRPTAIFTLNHRTSIWLIRALAELDIPIPHGMAVIGFDDFDLASVITPPLTTVSHSPVDLVTRSMALLFERMQNPSSNQDFEPAKIVLPVKLEIRASCGCPE